MSKDKKFYRNLKRTIKKEGNKKRRSFYKNNLEQYPEEAHFCDDFDFGDLSSKPFNGMDHDATRRKDSEDIVELDDGWHHDENDRY